ncbi:hypothetical protein BHM03_00055848 [Ensete ventricosum]|uniref:Syntaxin N-terminal domain-containing protein n=1 Tax=Ensete ventricosum TaxID=4639 RepID=A0A426ZK63_ENSVE|nr:hypothetical protein B296_00018314 [Ensete ventricosum]RZS23008.1 hypothetical protein BHM03_00055848 [Ensete ventricosum]
MQTLRETIHQEYREVVERRIFTVTGNRADEELHCFHWLLLFDVSNSMNNFLHCLLQVMDTLAEIQERHNTVKDLEKKLLELQQVGLPY